MIGIAPLPCPGCGVVAGPAAGPTHAYIGSSPGCWALYQELSLVGPGLGVSTQLVVDTYAAQHPGVPERRAIQSVCVHLVSICAALEHGWPPERGPDLLRRAVANPPGWRWLDPALPVGTMTVRDVLAADHPADRGDVARAWALDVWSAYEAHHATIRSWAADVLSSR